MSDNLFKSDFRYWVTLCLPEGMVFGNGYITFQAALDAYRSHPAYGNPRLTLTGSSDGDGGLTPTERLALDCGGRS